MEVLYPRCAGLDVHSKQVTACVRIANGTEVHREVREFGTFTKDLLELRDWLDRNGCTHVVMESTGVYWRPVWHILDGGFELILANAKHVRNVPGRKSDVNDSAWLADLLAHGLVKPSFVPDAKTQEIRDLTRTRKQLVREKAQHTLRIQKTLEDANVKLAHVVSDILGVAGRKILNAIAAGQVDAEALAALPTTSLRAAKKDLVESLRGKVSETHRFELHLHLQLIDKLDELIGKVDERIGTALEPFRRAVELLKTMPGIGDTSAQVLVGEIGTDMERFPMHTHLLSWAKLSPRLEESAGKRKSTRIQKGGRWLKPVLVQCAWAAMRVKDSYFRAQYLRIRAKRGPKKAIVAVAASMLTAAYYMLKRNEPYRDLGGDYFQRQDKGRAAKKLIRRLNDLGYRVELRPAA